VSEPLTFKNVSNSKVSDNRSAESAGYRLTDLAIRYGFLVLLVGILLQGLTMMSAPYYTQDFVKGAVLVLALMFTFSLSARQRG
jgi:hypothetical protein